MVKKCVQQKRGAETWQLCRLVQQVQIWASRRSCTGWRLPCPSWGGGWGGTLPVLSPRLDDTGRCHLSLSITVLSFPCWLHALARSIALHPSLA